MALNSDNVLLAQTGGVYAAPVGTTAPTDADVNWAAGFVDLGYLSEDGIVEAPEDTTNEIPGWQNGDIVRSMITGTKLTFAFTLIETTALGLKLYYKGSVLTGTGSGPATLEIRNPVATRYAFGFDVIDGTRLIRWIVESGEVTERGDITYQNSEPIGYEMTVTAYPVDGVIATKYYSDLPGLPAS